MEKKAKPIASKAQATHFYNAFKAGKITYQDLMKSVHATPDMKNLPDRITPKKSGKTDLAIKGLV